MGGWGLEWELDGVAVHVLVGSCGKVCLGTMNGIDQPDRDGEVNNGRRVASGQTHQPPNPDRLICPQT